MTIEFDRPSSVTLEIPVPFRTHDWFIEIQDDDGGRRVPLAPQRVIVGSSRECGLILRDATVSAKHCAIEVLGSGVVIMDLGSRNGTYVGNARVREAWGGAGTSVSIGRSSLLFVPAPSREDVADAAPLPGVAGGSIPMQRLASQVRRLAQQSASVLIFGETGTGKELIARALHLEGPRRAKPFVAINVAALPKELVESELFGHERGAFTGAVARRAGAFDEAQGGTLFLDEIGELPLEAQPKLLRALDGYEVRRVGGGGSGQRTDVRVIAATHVPLEERIVAQQFRRDLFHRLEVFVVRVPPLRARPGDIAPIARDMLGRLARDFGERSLTPRAVARLMAHDWPGNVRELRNVLCRACDAAPRSDVLDDVDISAGMNLKVEARPSALTPGLARALLREHAGNVSAAARAAGCPRSSFRKLIKG